VALVDQPIVLALAGKFGPLLAAFALFGQVLTRRQGCAATRKLFACLFCFPLGTLALFANELLAFESIHGAITNL
jgi:hypothetical protein